MFSARQTNAEEAMTTHDKAFRFVRKLCAIMMLGALAPEPTPAGAAARWTIDPASAHIEFAIDAVGYPRTTGSFRRFEGRISVDFEHPNRNSVAPSFDDYLRSAAFFDADRYPTIDFVSKSIQRIDDQMLDHPPDRDHANPQ